MKHYILSLALVVAALTLNTSPANAVTIQGASFITPSTGIAPCAVSTCLGFGTDINQIADGDTTNFNGYAGADGVVGIITLDLLGNFNLQSFTLWNDLNVFHEGIETFKLHFYDASDTFIQSTATLTAPVSQLSGQTYSFASSVLNVSKVDLETLSLLTGGVGSRIEIREVAFDGTQSVSASPVPEPGSILLLGSGLACVAAWRRKRAA
jgi:hypothetical protein